MLANVRLPSVKRTVHLKLSGVRARIEGSVSGFFLLKELLLERLQVLCSMEDPGRAWKTSQHCFTQILMDSSANVCQCFADWEPPSIISDVHTGLKCDFWVYCPFKEVKRQPQRAPFRIARVCFFCLCGKSLQCVFRLTNRTITSLIFLLRLGLKSGSRDMFWGFFFDLTAVFKNQTRLKTSQLSLSRCRVTVSNCDLAISCCALVLNYCWETHWNICSPSQ